MFKQKLDGHYSEMSEGIPVGDGEWNLAEKQNVNL